MSSSRPTDAPRRPARWRSPAGWSLRTRIVAIMIVLLTTLGLVVGATAEIFLRQQLYNQLDSRLDTALHPVRPGSGNQELGGYIRPPGSFDNNRPFLGS